MRVGLLTREYPPDVYGGAGVHVDFLARRPARLRRPRRLCMGAERAGRPPFAEQDPASPAPTRRCRSCRPTSRWPPPADGVDLVHSHTWYANMAGHWPKLLYDVPHVVTRPLARAAAPVEGRAAGRRLPALVLGGADRVPRRRAVVAVSRRHGRDIAAAYPEVPTGPRPRIYNGIDADFYAPDPDTSLVESLGVDLSRPYVAFVGRITRQKGVPHLLRAALAFAPECRSSCWPAPPTPPS